MFHSPGLLSGAMKFAIIVEAFTKEDDEAVTKEAIFFLVFY